MPKIEVNVTEEQIKAIEGIVIDAQVWLQEAWDGKANSCIKKVILAESDKNPGKMDEQAKADWIKNNSFQTRKQKEGIV